MSHKKIKIDQIAYLNLETYSKLDLPEVVEYLDTGSITRNTIIGFQRYTTNTEELPSRAQRKAKKNTILYSTVRPNLEHHGILENPPKNIIVSTGFTTIDIHDDTIDPKYLYYAITQKHYTEYLHTIATNNVSSYFSINPDDLGNLVLSVPEIIEDQKRIAAVLSALDAKIELNNRINTELEAMAKTLYDYWFVQFDFPDKNGKPFKSSGGKMVWNEQLKREIPEGWANATIEMVIDKQPSAEKLQTQNYSKIGSIPIIDQSQDYICGYTDSESTIIIPDQPHVIFGDHTRVVKLVNFKYARGADGTQVLVPKMSNMPGYLLYQIVSTIDLSNYGYARHFKFLKESKIVIPSQSVAQQYSKFVSSLYLQRTANIVQNRELSSLRDWLLPMLMNGQVKVV